VSARRRFATPRLGRRAREDGPKDLGGPVGVSHHEKPGAVKKAAPTKKTAAKKTTKK
jgi:hypothetical protein